MAKFNVFDATKKGFVYSYENIVSLAKQAIVPFVFHLAGFSLLIRNVTFNPDVPEGTNPMMYDVNLEFIIGLVLLVIGTITITFLFTDQARNILLKEENSSFWDGVMTKKEGAEVTVVSPSLVSKITSFIKTPYGLAASIFIGYLIVRNSTNQVLALIAPFLNQYVAIVLLIVNALFLLWLIRFGVAHIPAAIGYPIKDFIAKVKGVKFSFYLIFLMAATLIPTLGLGFVFIAIIIEVCNALHVPTDFSVGAAGALLYVSAMIVLNAASIFALDEVMKAKDDE